VIDQAVTPVAVPRQGDDDWDEVNHYFCSCEPDLGLCGADLTGFEEPVDDPVEPDDCIVCLELDPLPCARCGK
jgi:hypothetical protein